MCLEQYSKYKHIYKSHKKLSLVAQSEIDVYEREIFDMKPLTNMFSQTLKRQVRLSVDVEV